MMSSVVQLVPLVDDRHALSGQELLLQAIDAAVALTKHVIELEQHVRDLDSENIVLRVRVGMLEATQPAPRFEVPQNWITVEQASSLCGFAKSTVARWCKIKKIASVRVGWRTFVDPESLLAAARK